MKDLVDVWFKPRMRISILLSSLCYAALTIPFKDQWFLWGMEMRPSAFVPVLTSLIFGPAGAWGSAFGNLLGDAFGTFNSTSIFGFFGNLFLGYLPYKFWFFLFRKDSQGLLPNVNERHDFKSILVIGVLANMYCALLIGWGVYWLQDKNFLEIWLPIFINNTLTLLLLLPALMWFVPLSERYELNWFLDNKKEIMAHFTPRAQLFLMVNVACTILGSGLCLLLSWVEMQTNLEYFWYGLARQGIFWTAAITALLGAYYAVKD